MVSAVGFVCVAMYLMWPRQSNSSLYAAVVSSIYIFFYIWLMFFRLQMQKFPIHFLPFRIEIHKWNVTLQARLKHIEMRVKLPPRYVIWWIALMTIRIRSQNTMSVNTGFITVTKLFLLVQKTFNECATFTRWKLRLPSRNHHSISSVRTKTVPESSLTLLTRTKKKLKIIKMCRDLCKLHALKLNAHIPQTWALHYHISYSGYFKFYNHFINTKKKTEPTRYVDTHMIRLFK